MPVGAKSELDPYVYPAGVPNSMPTSHMPQATSVRRSSKPLRKTLNLGALNFSRQEAIPKLPGSRLPEHGVKTVLAYMLLLSTTRRGSFLVSGYRAVDASQAVHRRHIRPACSDLYRSYPMPAWVRPTPQLSPLEVRWLCDPSILRSLPSPHRLSRRPLAGVLQSSILESFIG